MLSDFTSGLAEAAAVAMSVSDAALFFTSVFSGELETFVLAVSLDAIDLSVAVASVAAFSLVSLVSLSEEASYLVADVIAASDFVTSDEDETAGDGGLWAPASEGPDAGLTLEVAASVLCTDDCVDAASPAGVDVTPAPDVDVLSADFAFAPAALALEVTDLSGTALDASADLPPAGAVFFAFANVFTLPDSSPLISLL